MKFPKNRDGDDLKSLWKQGVDFRTPQPLIFGILVPSQDRAENLLPILKLNGFDECTIEKDDEGPEKWWCTISARIYLTDVIETKENLNRISKRYDGSVNYWVYVQEFFLN